jgi:hypothetical protein
MLLHTSFVAFCTCSLPYFLLLCVSFDVAPRFASCHSMPHMFHVSLFVIVSFFISCYYSILHILLFCASTSFFCYFGFVSYYCLVLHILLFHDLVSFLVALTSFTTVSILFIVIPISFIVVLV